MCSHRLCSVYMITRQDSEQLGLLAPLLVGHRKSRSLRSEAEKPTPRIFFVPFDFLLGQLYVTFNTPCVGDSELYADG